MTLTVLLALLAGMLLAGAVVDAGALIAERRAVAASRARPRAAARWAVALARLGRRVGVPAPPGDLGARLAAAGLAASVRTADAMAVKAGVGVAAAGAAGAVLPGRPLAGHGGVLAR